MQWLYLGRIEQQSHRSCMGFAGNWPKANMINTFEYFNLLLTYSGKPSYKVSKIY